MCGQVGKTIFTRAQFLRADAGMIWLKNGTISGAISAQIRLSNQSDITYIQYRI